MGEYTSPTRTEVARACWIAFVSASCAIRNSVWATSGAGTTGLPAVTRWASSTPVRFAHAISSSSASSSDRPSNGEGARPSTLRLVSSKTASAAARASASASVAPSGWPSAIDPCAARICSNTDTSPCATVSCTSRAIRLRSAAAASARASDSAASCRRAFVIAIAACLANSSSSSASSWTNTRSGSRVKTTHEPTMAPRHQMGTPITPLSSSRSSGRTCPPGTSP